MQVLVNYHSFVLHSFVKQDWSFAECSPGTWNIVGIIFLCLDPHKEHLPNYTISTDWDYKQLKLKSITHFTMNMMRKVQKNSSYLLSILYLFKILLKKSITLKKKMQFLDIQTVLFMLSIVVKNWFVVLFHNSFKYTVCLHNIS